MSFLRKNARRLRDLRRHGVPITGDYRLAEGWGAREEGDYIDQKTQKEWLAQLVPDAKAVSLAAVPKRLRRGRAA